MRRYPPAKRAARESARSAGSTLAMGTVSEIVVPAREGRGVIVRNGQLLDIIDLEGQQVGDLVAWRRDDPQRIHVARAHGFLQCLDPAGSAARSCSPITAIRSLPSCATMWASTTHRSLLRPGTLFARFRRCRIIAAACATSKQARDLLGKTFDIHGEQAWNVFMHNRVTPEGKVVTDPAAHGAGATITLRAEMDVVALLSACPQDLTPCNAFNSDADEAGGARCVGFR